MNVVPAQVAGVRSIALASPPQKDRDGLPQPTILAACALLGVEEVYAVGGAQAIAMFAYGAGPCERVDLVTGPGNIYVGRPPSGCCKGEVGIDSEAGPTEIAILADDTADAAYVAADLVSQAEHDPTGGVRAGHRPLERSPTTVEAELDKQVFATKHTERIRTALGGPQSGIVLVDDIDAGRRRRRRLRRRAPRDRHTATPPPTPRACATPARSSSARGRRCRWATTAPAPTTCCRPPAAPATPAGSRCGRSRSRCTSSTTRARRSPRSPTTS